MCGRVEIICNVRLTQKELDEVYPKESKPKKSKKKSKKPDFDFSLLAKTK